MKTAAELHAVAQNVQRVRAETKRQQESIPNAVQVIELALDWEHELRGRAEIVAEDGGMMLRAERTGGYNHKGVIDAAAKIVRRRLEADGFTVKVEGHVGREGDGRGDTWPGMVKKTITISF